MNLASFIAAADGGGGGSRGWEPQVERSPEVSLLPVRFSINSVPSTPPSSADRGLWERLTVVLLASVKFNELFVKLFISDMPSLPLSWKDTLLWAKIAIASNMNRSNISRLILFPLVSSSQSFKYAVLKRIKSILFPIYHRP